MEGGQGVDDGGARAPGQWLMRLCACGLLICLLLTAPGCSGLCHWLQNGLKVGPNYCPPPAPLAEEWAAQDAGAVVAAPPEDFGWWGVFNDPTLNGLIDAAYQQNLDLAAAVTRIMEARARRSIAVGNLFPQSQSA